MLSYNFLQYVLDEWFERKVQPHLMGRSFLIRYADDCAPRRRERIASGASSNAMLRER
jgi:hypothetical protein